MERLLLHGLGQGPESWKGMRDMLPDGADLLCPDLFADCPEPVYDRLYQTVCRICGDCCGPVHLGGLSLGAVLALDYALHHPEKTASLLLIAPQYRTPAGLLRFQNAVFHLLPERAFRETGLTKQAMLRLSASMEKLDLSEMLGALTCPALIVCGERDRANRRAAQELADRLPAQLYWIGGSGHAVNTEAPEALAQAAEIFWKREGAL